MVFFVIRGVFLYNFMRCFQYLDHKDHIKTGGKMGSDYINLTRGGRDKLCEELDSLKGDK